MSSIINKVKATIENHTHKSEAGVTGTHTTGTTTGNGVPEGTAGPHNSRVANAADPRIDSDMDGSHNTGAHHTGHTAGAGLAGTHVTHPTGTTAGTHGTTGTYNNHNTATHGAPIHNSAVLNKIDPRVDSDMDGSRNMGATQTHGQTTHTGTTTGAGITGAHSSHTTGTGYGSTTAGPHDSNIANKVDPRVDSDMDGSRNMGATQTHGTTGTGYGTTTGTGYGSTTGTGYGSTNAGPHDSNIANKVDPRVDSDMDGSRNYGATQTHGTTGAGIGGTHAANGTHHVGHNGISSSATHQTPGTGTAPTTAGPHNSDMLNKLDPRVDSDMDGSKTTGGNKTYA